MKTKHEQDIPEYGTPDDENPEWTEADFARARPAEDVLAELFGAEATRTFLAENRRHIGQRITMCVDADVVTAFRQTGPGWQTRMNAVLRQGMPH